MNKHERAAARQRQMVADARRDGAAQEPAAAQVAAESPISAVSMSDLLYVGRPKSVPVGIPVYYLRFHEKSMQFGRTTDDQIGNKNDPARLRHANGNEHAIEWIPEWRVFLVGFADAGKRTAEFDLVGIEKVRSWRMA